MQLIGREHELALLTDRLSARRLVTVIGPGGIGKTSLARVAARSVADRYSRGWRFVDLTRAASPGAVGASIARQLGFPSFSALLDSPTDQAALVVIDNCEHVLDAAATVIATLLDACAAPTVLATSRSALEIDGESLVLLGPLTMTGPGSRDPASPAVQLFLERTRDAGVHLDDDQIPVVAELCRALDGVPLAIEMAAARGRTWSPGQILARLDDLDTLSRPRFRGTARHRSVRATIEWSYTHLDDGSRQVLDRLGVLSGWFDEAAARAVAGPIEVGGAAAATVDMAVDALVAASLLDSELVDGTMRYHLLETVRAYALEQLAARGETARTWDRFVDHVLAGVGEVVARGGRGWEATLVTELFDRFDGIAAALRWCLAHDGGPERALPLVAVLWGVIQQSHAEEVAGLAEAVLERWPQASTEWWADAVATAANCRFLLGDPARAIELAESALASATSSVFAPCTLRRTVGNAAWSLGDAARAERAFAATARAARTRGLLPLALEADVYRAYVGVAAGGGRDEALAALRAARVEAAQAGSHLNHVWAMTTEGHVLLATDRDQARTVLGAALALARDHGYGACVVNSLQGLATAALADGADEVAAERLLELIDDVLARGAIPELRGALHVAAALLERLEQPSWVALATAADALPLTGLFSDPGHPPFEAGAPPSTPLAVRDVVHLVRDELGTLADRPGAASPPDQRATNDPGTDTDATTATPNTFAEYGDFWTISFASRTITVKATKGLADLRRLLATPGREHHCVELAGAGVESPDGGAVIDPTARRQYEHRLRELQVEIDDAETANDLARGARAQVEFDTILDHLTAALGRGGDARAAGASTSERARSAVTQRIRSTIKRLAALHPELGRHLTASTVTGTYCVYRPEIPTTWQFLTS